MTIYRLTLKNGDQFSVKGDGTIIYDHARRMGPFSGQWKILGFTRRHHSHQMVSLADAAKGVDIGQGWVHDLDCGTHRMWGHPTGRRAVKVVKVHP